MDSHEEAKQLDQVSERLRTRFPEVDALEINQTVESFHSTYDGRPIRDFVPVLVEHQALDHFRIPKQRRDPVDA
jgi:hypothetical protein